jgi:hypothetical protein
MLGTDVLEQAGVAPRQGTWTTFGLTLEVDIAGLAAHFSATQRFSISDGAPIGAVTGSEWTANGALVRGWAANPSFGPSTRLVVTVDGTDWSPMNLAPASGVHWFVADKRTSDPLWVERGFADGLGFEFLAPAGTTCVAAIDERSGVHPAVPLGCIRSTSDGRPTAVVTQIQQLSAPGQFDRPVRVRGYVTDPWAGPGEVAGLTLVADYGTYYQIHYAEGEPTTERRGPISDGSGVFRFDVTMSGVAPGNVRFCVAVGRGNEPTWWLNLHLPPPGERRDLGCTVRYINAQLPTPPKGALDEMTASGGAVSARGWALDPNGGSPRVMLAIDGRPVAIDRTRLPRPDVRQAVGGDGNSGYQLTAGATAGSHEVCVLWEDTTTGQWSSPMCRQMVVK